MNILFIYEYIVNIKNSNWKINLNKILSNWQFILYFNMY